MPDSPKQLNGRFLAPFLGHIFHYVSKRSLVSIMDAIKPDIDAYFGHRSVPFSDMKPTLGGYYHPSQYFFRIELATIQYLWLVLFESSLPRKRWRLGCMM
jgi:hypothetical protein